MATAEELIIRVSADIEDLRRDMSTVKGHIGDVGTETEKTESRTSKATGFIKNHWKAVAVGITAVVGSFAAVGGKMITMAADADATGAKFNTIFSGMEVETQAWVDSFAATTGRHKYESMNMLADIQAVSTAMGVEKEVGVDMAKSLLERSTDIAAFFNAHDADVLEAVKSGLTGEMEGMKKYGVILSEANVQKELANMMGVEGAKNATDAQKVQARWNIILQQTSSIQGQQASESLSYQEQLKKLSNTLSVTFADAGKKAMESMTGLLIKINEILKGGGTAALSKIFEGLAGAVSWVAERVLDAAGAFLQWSQNGGFETIKAFIRDGIERMREMLGPTIAAVKEFAGSDGLGGVSEAAGVLIGWLKGLYTLLDDLGVFRRMGETLGTMVEAFLWVIGTISDVIIWVNDLYTTFRTTYDSIDSGTSTFRETINNGWNAIRTAISNIVAGILQDIIDGWNKFLNAIGLGNNKILGSITTIGESILGQWTSDMNKMPTVAGGAMQSAATTIRSYGDEIARAANSTAQRGIDALAAGFKEMQRIKAQAANVTISTPSSSSGSSSSNRKYDAAISQQQSSSRSSATAKNAPYDAPSQSVKPRKYASGGMIPHTGFHLLHEKEVVIPPKPNWNNLLVRPILNAFAQSSAPSGGVSRMEITIHNYGDLRALEKTLLRSKQAGTSNNMRVI